MLLSVLSLGGLEYLNLSKNWVYQCPKNILSGKIIIRKFRSQTSNNMGRWKKQRWEESERGRAEETRSEKRKSEKKEDTVGFQWFVAPDGRKVGSLKRRVQSHLARWEMKLHVVVARSAFPSQNVQSTPKSEHFWKLWCRKSARRCGTKHVSKSKCTKHWWYVGKVHAVVARSTFPSQNVKATTCSDHFWTLNYITLH